MPRFRQGATDAALIAGRARRQAAWLLVIPSAVLIYGWVVAGSFGPSGVPSPDPGYHLMMNSLNLAGGGPIVYIDQPAVPLQVIGALAIRVMHRVSGTGGVVTDVIARPGPFVAAYFLVLVGLYALALGGLGFAAWHTFGSLGAPVVVQALPILLGNYSRLVPVTTECLLLSVVTVLCTVLVRDLRHEAPSTARTVVYGALIGFGIATKLTFAPLLLIPLCMLRRRRAVVVYGVAILAAFVVSTAPIWPAYARLARWVADLALHQGAYGHGPSGIGAASTWLANLARVAGEQLILLLAVAGGLAVAARKLSSRSVAGMPWSARERLLLGLSLSALAQLVGTAKQPGARYLIPSNATLGLFIWLLLERIAWLRGRMPDRALRALAVVAALVLVTSALQIPPSTEPAIRAELDAHYRGWAIVYYAGSTSPVYAEADGSRMAGAYFAAQLAAMYPDAYLYNPWNGYLSDWAGHRLDLADIKGTRPGIIFQGARISDAEGLSFAEQYTPDTWPPLPAKLRETFHYGTEAIAEVVDE